MSSGQRVSERAPAPAAGPVSRPVPRRSTLLGLAGLAGAGLVAGCTSGGPEPGSPDTGPTGSPAATGSPAVEVDVRLAARVLAVEQAMLDRVVATGRAHPRLRDRLEDARSAHRAHVRLLATAVPDGATSPAAPRRRPSVAPSPAAALADLARAEDRLAGTGRRSSLAAESGAFARVLGSMAAAASQLAVVMARPGDADEGAG